jgi:hypothetical protein
MAATEHTMNDAIAAALRTTRRSWDTKKENTGVLKGSTKRPDVLVLDVGAELGQVASGLCDSGSFTPIRSAGARPSRNKAGLKFNPGRMPSSEVGALAQRLPGQ